MRTIGAHSLARFRNRKPELYFRPADDPEEIDAEVFRMLAELDHDFDAPSLVRTFFSFDAGEDAKETLAKLTLAGASTRITGPDLPPIDQLHRRGEVWVGAALNLGDVSGQAEARELRSSPEHRWFVVAERMIELGRLDLAEERITNHALAGRGGRFLGWEARLSKIPGR